MFYPHYTATSQAFSDIIKFQDWDELAIITEHAESKLKIKKLIIRFDFSEFRFTLSSRFT